MSGGETAGLIIAVCWALIPLGAFARCVWGDRVHKTPSGAKDVAASTEAQEPAGP